MVRNRHLADSEISLDYINENTKRINICHLNALLEGHALIIDTLRFTCESRHLTSETIVKRGGSQKWT